jgi:hypothetical protein
VTLETLAPSSLDSSGNIILSATILAEAGTSLTS